jgi:hypothetical protein
LEVKRTLAHVGNIGKYKNAPAKYKKYIEAVLENIKNINWPAVYIAGAIRYGAEMLLLAAPPAISAVLAGL